MLWVIVALLAAILLALVNLNSTVKFLYKALRRAGRAREEEP